MRILFCQAALKTKQNRQTNLRAWNRNYMKFWNLSNTSWSTLTFLQSQSPGVTQVTKKTQPLVPAHGGTFYILQISYSLSVGARRVLTVFGEDVDSQGVPIIPMLWVKHQQFYCQLAELNLIRFGCVHPGFTSVVAENTAVPPSFSSYCS